MNNIVATLSEFAASSFAKKIFVSLASVSTVYFAIKFYLKKSRKTKRKAYPKDVVILHQFPRGFRAPSASPFVLKLETWYIIHI
jgi:hypothetical protein